MNIQRIVACVISNLSLDELRRIVAAREVLEDKDAVELSQFMEAVEANLAATHRIVEANPDDIHAAIQDLISQIGF